MQTYPPFLPQQSMGSFPMFQYPQNIMGFYAGTTPQNWNQVTPTAPPAPSQPAVMEVDNDAWRSSTKHHSNKPLSSSSTNMIKKKLMDKGKKRGTEDYSRWQDIQEAEDHLDEVLCQLDDLEYDRGLARAAVDTDAAQSLVEFLLRRINVLRGEVRAAQRVQERAEQDVR